MKSSKIKSEKIMYEYRTLDQWKTLLPIDAVYHRDYIVIPRLGVIAPIVQPT